MVLMRLCSLLGIAFLCGCATAMETLSESGHSYTREKDSEGHTKYVSRRVVSDYRPSPGFLDQSVPLPTIEIANRDSSEPAAALTTGLPATNTTGSESEALGGLAFTISANGDAANGDISYEWYGDYISGGAGIAFLSSDRTYFGFNGQVRLQFPWKLTPYLGVGLYGGDSRTCKHEPLGGGYSEEVCEKYFLFAATGDLGLQYAAEENVKLRAFARGFTQTKQGDPRGDTLYGMGIAFTF